MIVYKWRSFKANVPEVGIPTNSARVRQINAKKYKEKTAATSYETYRPL